MSFEDFDLFLLPSRRNRIISIDDEKVYEDDAHFGWVSYFKRLSICMFIQCDPFRILKIHQVFHFRGVRFCFFHSSKRPNSYKSLINNLWQVWLQLVRMQKTLQNDNTTTKIALAIQWTNIICKIEQTHHCCVTPQLLRLEEEKKIAQCWLFYLIWFKQSPLLHWIFRVSDCICGRCWLQISTVGHCFVPKMMQIASNATRSEQYTQKLSCVHELVIGMNERWNGQIERCEAKGHGRLMVFCYSASRNGTKKLCILHNERFIVSRY